MSEVTIIGRRYTLVIPKSIRKKLDLKEGQKVLIRLEKGRILIEPLPSNPLSVLEEVVGEPYEERKDEAKAERWLRNRANS